MTAKPAAVVSGRMISTDKKQCKEEPQPAPDLEERLKVLEEYIADLRAVLDKLRCKVN